MAGGCWSWGGIGELSAEFGRAEGRGLPGLCPGVVLAGLALKNKFILRILFSGC